MQPITLIPLFCVSLTSGYLWYVTTWWCSMVHNAQKLYSEVVTVCWFMTQTFGQICMCVISIIRFLTDHRVAVPLAVTTRMLETHDVRLSDFQWTMMGYTGYHVVAYKWCDKIWHIVEGYFWPLLGMLQLRLLRFSFCWFLSWRRRAMFRHHFVTISPPLSPAATGAGSLGETKSPLSNREVRPVELIGSNLPIFHDSNYDILRLLGPMVGPGGPFETRNPLSLYYWRVLDNQS